MTAWLAENDYLGVSGVAESISGIGFALGGHFHTLPEKPLEIFPLSSIQQGHPVTTWLAEHGFLGVSRGVESISGISFAL